MKLYEAKHYIPGKKRQYCPGEVIDEELTEKQAARLLRLGAVKEIPGQIVTPERRSAPVQEDPTADPPEDDHEDSCEDPAEDAAEDTDEEEELPAPEIDVTDGIGDASKATRKGGKK